MESYGYVYLTENQTNHKWYIGQHHWENPGIDPKYYGSGTRLLLAMNKYGKENFTCTPIDWAYSQEELDEKELWWIAYFRSLSPYEGYNISDGGNSPMNRHKHTEESKKKMRENHADFSGENHPMYGKPRSKETKRKISKSLSRKNPLKCISNKRKKDGPFSGENNPRAKLTEKDVLEIVELHNNGLSYTEIALMFNMHHSAISRICNGLRWSNVTGIGQ